MTEKTIITRPALAVVGVLALGGCADGLGLPFGSGGGGGDAVATRSAPDARGVITRDGYQVVVAGPGDDLAAIAARVGLAPAELARHNGLPITYRPREGELLALPRPVDPSLDGVVDPGAPTPGWSASAAATAIETAPLAPPGSVAGTVSVAGTAPNSTAATAPTATPFGSASPAPVVNPIRHRVVAGETAYSIARRYGVSVTELANWNGLDRDLTIRVDQELLVPANAPAGVPGNPPSQTATPNAPGTSSTLPAPPSAAQPLPDNEDVALLDVPASPQLDQFRTPPGAQGKLLTPVSGQILRPYNPASGPEKNEGIDFAAPAGTEVRAAEAGEIALISESLGGLGTIVLIRHADALMTVYGRVTDVRLRKGDAVRRGQTIGVVAEGDPPNLHFEVRRGTEAVDPTPYL